MAEKESSPTKGQMTLAEYMKLKEKLAQSKLKLHFPLPVKVAILVPAVFLLFLLIFIIFHLRFQPGY